MAIKSFVTIKPFKISSKLDNDFNEIRRGINRTGVVTEGIANNFFETNTIIEFERDWLRKDIAEKNERLDNKDKISSSILLILLLKLSNSLFFIILNVSLQTILR